MKKITYVTGNKFKILTAEKYLGKMGFEVEGKKIDCPEIQADSIEEIAAFSAKWAANELGCPVLKNDSGAVVPALKGFPGPYTHYVSDTLDAEGILKLMAGEADRSVYFLECLAYCCPGEEPIVFTSRSNGTIALEASGDFGWGWDRIFIPEGETVPMAHFDDDERVRFWDEKAYTQLAEYLSKR